MVQSDINRYSLDDVLPIYTYDGNLFMQQDKPSTNDKISGHQIQRDFEDDFPAPPNIQYEVYIKRLKRYLGIVRHAKQKYNYCCQICGRTFLMDNGERYCEAHHITPLSLDGSQDELNIIILCADHHRMFHYAKEQIDIGDLIDNKRIIAINEQSYEVVFK